MMRAYHFGGSGGSGDPEPEPYPTPAEPTSTPGLEPEAPPPYDPGPAHS